MLKERRTRGLSEPIQRGLSLSSFNIAMLDWIFAVFSPAPTTTKGGRYDVDDCSDSGSSNSSSSSSSARDNNEDIMVLDQRLSTTPHSPDHTTTRPIMNPSTPPRPTARGRPKMPPAPTKPKPTRGRPRNRLTSAQRSPITAGRKKLARRKPLTPTTRTAIAKERRHRAYLRKREGEMEEAKVLGKAGTYWRALRSGRRYRALGGARPK